MATEAEKRMHRCCFTGHRPEKLQEPEGVVTVALEKEIRQAIEEDRYQSYKDEKIYRMTQGHR